VVRERFLAIASREPGRVRVLPADQPPAPRPKKSGPRSPPGSGPRASHWGRM
jgi:hypothetical protein